MLHFLSSLFESNLCIYTDTSDSLFTVSNLFRILGLLTILNKKVLRISYDITYLKNVI